MVKPTRPAIETNLVVNTDRRTYLIELRPREAVHAVGRLVLSQDQLMRCARNAMAEAAAPITGVDQRRYRYVIEGDTPPWRPVRPTMMADRSISSSRPAFAHGEMPPLFVIGQDGGRTRQLSRARPYMIVDRLFAAAELRLGGEKQKKVRIVRTDGRPQQ